jgi:hypothetical protein
MTIFRMLKKPTPAEFEISKTGIRHRPTKERFAAHPGKPVDGQWQDGHTLAAAEYDQDEIRQMGRKLWAKHIAERKRSR